MVIYFFYIVKYFFKNSVRLEYVEYGVAILN